MGSTAATVGLLRVGQAGAVSPLPDTKGVAIRMWRSASPRVQRRRGRSRARFV